MKNVIILLIIGLSIPACRVNAQNIGSQTISWHVDSLKDMLSDTVIVHTSEFVSAASEVKWVLKRGATVYTFDVANTEGSWSDVTVDGSRTYIVSLNNRSGRITFSRLLGSYRIRFRYDMTDSDSYDFDLHVSEIEIR